MEQEERRFNTSERSTPRVFLPLRGLWGFAAFAVLLGPVLWYTEQARTHLASSGALPKYEVADIGPLAFDPSSSLNRYVYINNKGQVAGNWLPKAYCTQPYFWDNGRNTRITLSPDILSSRALAINNRGAIVGYNDCKRANNFQRRAFIWQSGRMRDLGTPPGSKWAAAVSINDNGQILLESDQGAFLWQNEKFTRLNADGAMLINSAGQLAGTGHYHPGAQPGSAFLYAAGKPLDLGILAGGVGSKATAINDRGQIVGYVTNAMKSRGFLWQNGHLVDLGAQAGSDTSQAFGINNRGQIVGGAGGTSILDSNSRAFLWQGDNACDLNTRISPISGWLLLSAAGINDRGQIVGYGTYNGVDQAFLLSPIR